MSFLSSWVIDLGATNHMTHSSQMFSTYSLCPRNKKIATANGSLAIVVGQGKVHSNIFIVLKNVLHVPGFPPIFSPFIDLPKN